MKPLLQHLGLTADIVAKYCQPKPKPPARGSLKLPPTSKENPTSLQAYQRGYREIAAHREKMNARARLWHQNNKERRTAARKARHELNKLQDRPFLPPSALQVEFLSQKGVKVGKVGKKRLRA